MLPVIAIVGRPNVGKSTLFNRLTASRDALVDDQPGVTRDRIYGEAAIGGRRCLVVDTGGLGGDDPGVDAAIDRQVEQLLDDADAVVLVVDAREGCVVGDEQIAARLRRRGVAFQVAVNKSEGLDPDSAGAEFLRLGVAATVAISARRGSGVGTLLEALAAILPEAAAEPASSLPGPRVAVVGRPNVGKSTLINALAGSERVIVLDQPGTTRDSIEVPVTFRDRPYVLIDTAGIRRRPKVRESIERFSVVRTLRAVEQADVAVLMVDARQEIGEQDAAIAGMIEERGCAVVVAVNKWDRLDAAQRRRARDQLQRRLRFLPPHDEIFMSALYGTGLGELMEAIDRAAESAALAVATADLNRTLRAALDAAAPPMRDGRVIKLKFIHQSGSRPPSFVIHGNQVRHLPASYRRYLANWFQRAYALRGTRPRLTFRQGDNPYAGRARRRH